MISTSVASTTEALAKLKASQGGNFKPIKTRYSHLNNICHGGLTPQQIITIGGLSSFGKSHTLRCIEEDIFNEELNPGSREEVILIKVDWEMTKFESLINRVHTRTGLSFADILYKKPSTEVEQVITSISEELSAPYLYESFQTYNPANFDKIVRAFCGEHMSKKQIVLTIDNANLIDTTETGESFALAEMTAVLIKLKRDVANLTIIQLAQLNRSLKERTVQKEHFPRTTDFYNSSKLEHASDVMIIIHNPYLLGLQAYGIVNKERYEYLDVHLTHKNNWSEFKTKGLVFWHYVKVRAKDDMQNFKDIFIEKIYDVAKTDTEVKTFIEEPPNLEFPRGNIEGLKLPDLNNI